MRLAIGKIGKWQAERPAPSVKGRPAPPAPFLDQRPVLDLRQYVPREQVGLCRMRIARQDKRHNSQGALDIQLGPHLIGITDVGRAAARAGAADTGPEIGLGIAVVRGGSFAQRGLSLNAG